MMRTLIVSLLMLVTVALSPACNPRVAGRLLGAAVVAAAIVGTAKVLHDLDRAHFERYCRAHRRWHDGRWVYWCEGRWVYYDRDAGHWYYYAR